MLFNNDTTTNSNSNFLIQKSALISGVGLLLMMFFAIFAEATKSSLILKGNEAATFNNILNNAGKFKIAITAYYVVVVLDLIVAISLYHFLKNVNKVLSFAAAALRIFYALFFSFAISKLVVTAVIAQAIKDDFYKFVGPSVVNNYLNSFDTNWSNALFFFGLHLSAIGVLAIKAKSIPSYIGILLLISGLGYSIDSLIKLINPNNTISIAMFTFFGEVVFFIWLLIKGRKISLD